MQTLTLNVVNKIPRTPACLIHNSLAGPPHKQCPDRPATLQFFRTLDSQMQCSLPLKILQIELLLSQPAKQVYKCYFWGLETGPVEWGGATFVTLCQGHVALLEVVEGDWLVTLGGDVHHGEAELVLSFYVRAQTD